MPCTQNTPHSAPHLHLAPTTVAELAERLLNTPSATLHSADRGLADDHQRGLISATSMLTVALHEATGDWLDRGIARDIARRIITAYIDQFSSGGGRR